MTHHIPQREHHNADGTPKHAWPTRRQAADARRRMNMSHVNIYRCRTCQQWHHGHYTPTPKNRPHTPHPRRSTPVHNPNDYLDPP